MGFARFSYFLRIKNNEKIMADPIIYGGVLSETTVYPKEKIKGWHVAIAVYLLLLLFKKAKR